MDLRILQSRPGGRALRRIGLSSLLSVLACDSDLDRDLLDDERETVDGCTVGVVPSKLRIVDGDLDPSNDECLHLPPGLFEPGYDTGAIADTKNCTEVDTQFYFDDAVLLPHPKTGALTEYMKLRIYFDGTDQDKCLEMKPVASEDSGVAAQVVPCDEARAGTKFNWIRYDETPDGAFRIRTFIKKKKSTGKYVRKCLNDELISGFDALGQFKCRKATRWIFTAEQ